MQGNNAFIGRVLGLFLLQARRRWHARCSVREAAAGDSEEILGTGGDDVM